MDSPSKSTKRWRSRGSQVHDDAAVAVVGRGGGEAKPVRKRACVSTFMIKIEAATHDQKTPHDLLAFANAKRWSKSKCDFERYGDLTLPNLIRAMRKEMGA